MKPERIPFIRDAGRLLALNVDEMALSRAKRERLARAKPVTAKARLHDQLWPTRKWWPYLSITAFDSLPESKNPDIDHAIVSAWRNLGAISKWNTNALADLIFILIETTSVDRFCANPLPAFSAEPIDLRPWLGDRKALRALVVASSDRWEEALSLLTKDQRISKATVRKLRRVPPREDFCADLYTLVQFGHREEMLNVSWDETQVRTSLPFLRGGSLRQVRLAMKTIDHILLNQPSATTSLRRFLLSADLTTAAAWIRLARHIRDSSLLQSYFDCLTRSTAKKHIPPTEFDQIIHQCAKRTTGHRCSRLQFDEVFTHTERGLPAFVIIDLLQLSSSVSKSRIPISLPTKVTGRTDISSLLELGKWIIREKANQGQRCYGTERRAILSLWRESLGSSVIRNLINAKIWEAFPAECAIDLVRFILRTKQVTRSRTQFRNALGHNFDQILAQPDAKKKIRLQLSLQYMRSLRKIGSMKWQEASDLFAEKIIEGFDNIPWDATYMYFEMRRFVTYDQLWSLGSLSRSAIKQMDHANRSNRNSSSIREAIPPFLEGLRQIDLAIFFRQPKQFMRLLRKLGSLSKNLRRKTIARVAEHPFLTVDPLRIGLQDACFLFDHILSAKISDPVPEKLRQAAIKRIQLREDIESHYRNEFADRLATAWIGMIDQEIDHHLSQFQQKNLEAHSIEFQMRIGKENRRGLNRFLNAIHRGDTDYRDRHPANQKWIKKYAHLSLDGWKQRDAAPFHVEIPAYGDVTIRLEDDPQEELKMGTYVDSCLGIGGCNQFSAVANTLDINKRIAYLRDGTGKVLGRQLLAISDDGKLIPFDVYRTQNRVQTKIIENAFREYDQHLAATLSLPLFQGSDEYEIASLVVPHWYDDGNWEWDDEPSS